MAGNEGRPKEFSICKAFCRVSDLSDRSSDPAGKIEGDTAGQQQGYEGNINQLVGQDLDRGRHRPKRRKGIDDQRCFIFRDQYIAICQDFFRVIRPIDGKGNRILLRFQQLFIDRCDLIGVISGTGIIAGWFEIHRTSVERGNVNIDIMCIGDFFDIVEKSFAVFDFVGFFDVFYDSIGLFFFHYLIKVVEEQNLQEPQDDHEEGGEQNKIKPCFKCDTAVVQSMLQICSPLLSGSRYSLCTFQDCS